MFIYVLNNLNILISRTDKDDKEIKAHQTIRYFYN